MAEEQDQLVAAARADALQVMEDAERALVELARGDAARLALTLEIGDAAREGAVRLEHFGQSRGLDHRRGSSLMCSGWRVRRLICASSSRGLSGTYTRR